MAKKPTHHDRMALVRALLAHALMAHQDAMDNGPGGPATMAGPMPPGGSQPPMGGPPPMAAPAGMPMPGPASRKPSAAFPFGHFSGRR